MEIKKTTTATEIKRTPFSEEDREEIVSTLGHLTRFMDPETASRIERIVARPVVYHGIRDGLPKQVLFRNEALLRRLNVAEMFRPFGSNIMEFVGKMMDTECILIGYFAERYFGPGYQNDRTWRFRVGGGRDDILAFKEFLERRDVIWDDNVIENDTSDPRMPSAITYKGRLCSETSPSANVVLTLAPTLDRPKDIWEHIQNSPAIRYFIAGWGAVRVTGNGEATIYSLADNCDGYVDYDVGMWWYTVSVRGRYFDTEVKKFRNAPVHERFMYGLFSHKATVEDTGAFWNVTTDMVEIRGPLPRDHQVTSFYYERPREDRDIAGILLNALDLQVRRGKKFPTRIDQVHI